MIPTMWAIDLTHTSHTHAQTGIQQVCRSLSGILQSLNRCTPVVFDRYAGRWRKPDKLEYRLIGNRDTNPSGKRSSRWTLYQKLRGMLMGKRLQSWHPGQVDGMFFPEIIDRHRTSMIFGTEYSSGRRKIALFHDAIPAKFPHWCAAATVAHFPEYLRCLARFDHVACVSETSREDLLEQWGKMQVAPAATSVVPLGVPRIQKHVQPVPQHDIPVVLSIGTLEQRKNHASLMKAANELWNKGIRFKLVLAGMANSAAANEALQLLERLRSEGRAIEWTGPVDNASMDTLLRESDLLAYPSLYEGFGLPVLEALAAGKPVLTTEFGALREQVAGGGCRVCDGSVGGIRDALGELLADPDRLKQLTEEAGRRRIRTMDETARSLAAVFDQVARGNPSSS